MSAKTIQKKNILKREEDKDNIPSFSCLFRKGQYKGQYFDLEIYMCEDPLCYCREITIEFIPKDKDQSEGYRIELNLQEKELIEDSENDEVFGHEFLNNLSPDDWEELTLVHYDCKSMLGEFSDFGSLTAEFSFDDVEDGVLIFYDDIIPFPILIFTKMEDSDILFEVVDIYCLTPECGCTNAHLLFYPTWDDRTIDYESYEALHVEYDYKANEWCVLESGSSDVSPEALMEALISSLDIAAIYSKRHANLGMLYKNFRKEYINDNLIAHSEKIPRNSPCPCGSGKKYKKCCLFK